MKAFAESGGALRYPARSGIRRSDEGSSESGIAAAAGADRDIGKWAGGDGPGCGGADLRKALIGVLAGLVLGGVAAGCTASRGGWPPTRQVSPALDAELVRQSRIADLAPHFLLRGDGMLLFLCRWPRGTRIPVSLPPDGNGRELSLLRQALAAWSGAGLGISLVEAEAAEATLEIRFSDRGAEERAPSGAGDALADCRLSAGEGDIASAEGRLDARLDSASIHLNREQIDDLGRRIPLDDSELIGTALHELGHALGFSSHVARGDSIMVRTSEQVRRIGASVLRGESLPAPNLRALYELPNGFIVGSVVLDPIQLERATAFQDAAERRHLDGPFTRVGDSGARLFYRSRNRVPAVLSVRPWPGVLSRPLEISFRIRFAASD